MGYFIFTNNEKIKELEERYVDCRVLCLTGDVQDVLTLAGESLLEKNMVFVADFMGGRRARAFPYLTVIMEENAEHKGNKEHWNKILDYQILNLNMQTTYKAYSQKIRRDFEILDYSLTETALKNLQRKIR